MSTLVWMIFRYMFLLKNLFSIISNFVLQGSLNIIPTMTYIFLNFHDILPQLKKTPHCVIKLNLFLSIFMFLGSNCQEACHGPFLRWYSQVSIYILIMKRCYIKLVFFLTWKLWNVYLYAAPIQGTHKSHWIYHIERIPPL